MSKPRKPVNLPGVNFMVSDERIEITATNLYDKNGPNFFAYFLLRLLEFIGQAERIGLKAKEGRGRSSYIWRIPKTLCLTFKGEEND